jgi:hemoglobin/transferrin/lactoferrin receptor protein
MSTLRCFLSRVDLFLTTLIVAPNAKSTIYYSVVDITGGTTTSRNLTNAWLFGYEAELNYEALHFFAGVCYSQARGKDEDTGAPLTAIPADKLVAQLGVRDPGWRLSAGLQGRFVDRQDRVPEGVPETPGYAVYDLYASWLPGSASLLGLRVDFGIDNLTDKAYRRHLSVLDEAGQNFKISVSYQF